MKLKDLTKEQQESILLDCEKVKNGILTEDDLLDLIYDRYGDDFYLPSHYYTKYEYEPEQIKQMTLQMTQAGTGKPKKEISKPKAQEQPKPKPKTTNETLSELDALLDSMLED